MESKNDSLPNVAAAPIAANGEQEQSTKAVTVTLLDWEIVLIVEALNNLSTSREEEIKWAGNDKELIRMDTEAIEEIEALCAKLGEAK